MDNVEARIEELKKQIDELRKEIMLRVSKNNLTDTKRKKIRSIISDRIHRCERELAELKGK